MASIVSVLCLVLGAFEFVSVYSLTNTDSSSILDCHKHLPAVFIEDASVKILFTVYLLTLGCQRFTYAFAYNRSGIAIRLSLIVTHVIEAYLWWSIAVFTKSTEDTKLSLLLDIINLKYGFNSCLVLIGVPALICIFIVDLIIAATSKHVKNEDLLKSKAI